jgi:hypothetical protein
LDNVRIAQGVAAASLRNYQSDRFGIASFAYVPNPIGMNTEPVGLPAAYILHREITVPSSKYGRDAAIPSR